jgi:signal transduction histidine kinase
VGKLPNIEASEYTDLNRVIRWFIIMRWAACGGVFGALLLGSLLFEYDLPYSALYSLNGALLLINLLFTLYFFVLKNRGLSRKETTAFFHTQVFCDFTILFFLVYFTGFLANPFIYYFVFHIMLSSYIFPSSVVIVYVNALIALLILAVVLEALDVIPHYALSTTLEARYNELLLPRTVGLCTTLIFSAYLINSIKTRIEEKGRMVETELDRYKSLDKVKSNFILQVTHELRGPIAAVSGYHEMIAKGITGNVNPQTKETIQKANRRTENLLNIIDEMIDYAYMTTDQETTYAKSSLGLKTIVENNIDLFSDQAMAKDMNFVAVCPEELTVWANRDLLNIILSNLITNAAKYSPRGSTVTISCRTAREHVHIYVKDEGIGIEARDMAKIFEEFYRSKEARKIERDGTGLGLPIVKRAVESLGGTLKVSSRAGAGTTVHIHLPKDRSE